MRRLPHRSRRRRRAAGARSAAALAGLALLLACAAPGGARPGEIDEQRTAMGTTFRIRVLADDADAGRAAVEAAYAEIDRVEALLSEWKDTSEISAVNRAAGDAPVRVGPELLEVVTRSLELSRLTGGAFDITFAACAPLWSFADRRIPDDASLASCLDLVGSDGVEVDADASTIRLAREGMRIGIAGIGKGYGVDRAADVLEARGVTDYIVDGGGDMRLRAERRGRPWTVGIADPRREGELLESLSLDGGAVVTSGDYFQYFEVEGVRYHHILDPSTGRPAWRSVAVTVIAPRATDADALATGLFVLGPGAGLSLVERLPDVEALIVTPDLSLRRSSGFPGPDPRRP